MESVRSQRLATAACFVFPLALYAVTAARSVQGGDTGEFGLIGQLGGVAHPPGYPLYSLFARLGGALPFGAPFWRVALISALFGAATVAVLQRLTFHLTRDLWASVAAALIFAVSREQWRLSGVPEVFTLNALAAAMLILCSLRLDRASSRTVSREAFLLGLVGGLGLTNHLTLVWCAPIAFWFLARAMRRERAQALKLLALALGGGLLGLTPYLLLPIFARTARPGAVVWGDVESVRGFIAHVLRQEYGTFSLSAPKEGSKSPFHAGPVLYFLRSLPGEFAFVGFALGLVGVVVALRRERSWALPIAVSFLLAGIFFPFLFNLGDDPVSRSIYDRFFLLPNLLFVPFIAMGFQFISRWLRSVTRWTVLAVVLLVAGALHFSQANWGADDFIERYYVAVVRQTEPNAIVVGTSDTSFSAMGWVRHVLHERPDVRYVDAVLLARPWYFERIKREIPQYPLKQPAPWPVGRAAATAAAAGPTYVLASVENDARQAVQLEPNGFSFHVVRPGSPAPLVSVIEQKLVEASELIGPQPAEAIDAQNETVRMWAGVPWLQLGKQYERIGNQERANACYAQGLRWISETGVGSDVRAQVERRE